MLELRGRRQEKEALDRLLKDVRLGQSRALVLRGEAGCGKTALLAYAETSASFARVLRAAGVESESEIAYSALQQLCFPLLDYLGKLPGPQREALATAFGLESGPAPQTLLIGLAVLGLFAEAAAERPLVCVVDDAQWIDVMSAVILGFVARRLDAESVAIIAAARRPGDDNVLPGLPELLVEGLPEAEARALLDSVLPGPVDSRVRERIVAETRGNPLALLELTRGLSAAELAFGFGGHSAAPLAGRLEQGYQQRIGALPPEARLVLLAAAVEPVGDAPLLWRALRRLGVGPDAAVPAQADGLIEFGPRVRFPHPLVRSAAWRLGQAAELRAVHAALAEATDPGTDPDRRAWHRAHATLGPDDEVAAELEGSAGRALARGGRSAAATFLQRAAELSLDPGRRGSLLVAAAEARADAGAYAQVPELLGAAEMSPLEPLQQARVERLRARVAFVLNPGPASVPQLVAAAQRLQDLDAAAARDTFLMAIDAAVTAGRFGADELRAAAQAAREAAPAAGSAGSAFPDLLLAGLVAWVLDGRAAAVPLLDQALATRDPAGHVWQAATVANEVFRFDLTARMGEEAARDARASGALALLPSALALQAGSLLDAGRFAGAAGLLDEIEAVTRATGASGFRLSRLILAAYQGPEDVALELVEAKLRDATERGEGRQFAAANIARAMLHNALGNHRLALQAVQENSAYEDIALYQWSLRELIEAAVRAGEPELAASARASLAERTAATPTRAALGIQALADALAGPSSGVEARFREAVERLSVPETAVTGYRARLLFGEWLRRANRRAEARVELRAAHEAFSEMGAELFAARAGRELAATGETVRRRQTGGHEDLTPQEAAIVRLAVAGRTNPEIGAALFLSPRTVEWHLRKVFTKLGISSRRELAG